MDDRKPVFKAIAHPASGPKRRQGNYCGAAALLKAPNRITLSGPDQAPTFSVVSMMREEPAVIQRFVDFYRAAGAEQIMIFHDGAMGGRDGLDLAGVDLTECDEAFWTDLCFERPKSFAAALSAGYMEGMAKCKSDWLLVVDADEFVVGDRPIRSLLASVPSGIDALRIRTAEAVWGPTDDFSKDFGSTHFRTPLRRWISGPFSLLLYGDLAPLFHRGILGHVAGKHFVRRAGKYTQIGPHDTKYDGRPIGRWAHEISDRNTDFVVAHFDAIGFDRWREKWRRRISGEIAAEMRSGRTLQMKRIEAALNSSDSAARRLFARLYGVNRVQKLFLSRIGCLYETSVFGTRS